MIINKKRAVLIILALIITFLGFRGFLYFWPNVNLDVGAYNIHHLFVGIVMILLAGLPLAVLSGKSWKLDFAAIIFGVGLSMALDQWLYLIMTDGSDTAYLLPVSFWGGAGMIGLAVIYIIVLMLLL